MTALAKRQPIVVCEDQCKEFADGRGLEVVLKSRGVGGPRALAGQRGTKAAIKYAQSKIGASHKDLAIEARSSQPTLGQLGGAAIAEAMTRAADPDSPDTRVTSDESWWYHSYKVRDVSSE